MQSSRRLLISLMGVLAVMCVFASPARAQAIITNGTIALGVDLYGQLNVPDDPDGAGPAPGVLTPYNSAYVGLYSYAMDGDATSPGCLCEGFGIAADSDSGWANNNFGAPTNLTSVSFASTAATATTVAEMTSLPGFTVTHEYRPSTSLFLYEAFVTLTNNTGVDFVHTRYNRTMDWDIPPTTFSEYVTIESGGSLFLEDYCNNGFQSSDPLEDCDNTAGFVTYIEDTDFTDVNGQDHGARFTFNFGALADGASRSFSIFYGAAPDEISALSALNSVGAEVYSLGQCSPGSPDTSGGFTPIPCVGGPTTGTPQTFIFGFGEVGGVDVEVVPEPATMMLLGTGLAAVAARRRRNRQTAV